MSKISKLSPQVADMIAAGEVVERPASVVKELIENAIDAGAHSITIELRRGGMSYLRVTDDGCGISAEDAPNAFLRHATSKIHDERGLEAIGTLGFRGEALAAVASVSRVELLSRESGAKDGITLTLEGGADDGNGVTAAGCPEGTTIIVRDLFFNTPARLKFMKTDSAESAAAVAAALRCAMSHPELAFRVIKDGDDVFRTDGSGDTKECVYALLGRDFALNLRELPPSGDDTMSVAGLITPPNQVRGNRGAQYFFVNGRCVRSQILTAALEQAYRTLLPGGRFPGCVLYLTMRANYVDVNVHPAKTEIKFLFERAVFDLIHYAVKSTLNLRAGVPPSTPHSAAPSVVADSVVADSISARLTGSPPSERVDSISAGSSVAAKILPEHQTVIPELFSRQKPPETAQKLIKSDTETSQIDANFTPDFTIIGEVYGGYIIVQCDTELLFIDKHAAHERIIFDRLKSRREPSMPQILLTPLIVEPGREEFELILSNLDILENLGFSIEDFGGGALAVRQIPSEIDFSDISALIGEIADSIRLGAKVGSLGRIDEILSTVACKAAIKVGKASDIREFAPLVNAVLAGQISNCPHGRPVTFRLPKEQIEKAIRRR
jgi:DNA mismatch repair protein MutL